jgi:hypothetical protein
MRGMTTTYVKLSVVFVLVAYFKSIIYGTCLLVFLDLATGDGRVGEVEYWGLLSFCVLLHIAFNWHAFDHAVQNELKCKLALKVQFYVSH